MKDAHLPAYAKVGFTVIGMYDLKKVKAIQLAQQYNIHHVCDTIGELVRLGVEKGVVFDLALPASEIINVLPLLPDKSAVLIQKPMGENLVQAKEILSICKKKRWSPRLIFNCATHLLLMWHDP